MKFNRRIILLTTLILATVYLIIWISNYSIAINPSRSMPRGLYLLSPFQSIKRGQLVAVCVPNSVAAVYRNRHYLTSSSRCAVGLSPMLKPIIALPGDVVKILSAGTMVNDVLLPGTQIFHTDIEGRPIDHLPIGWSKRLANNEFFVLSNYVERSLDSRYYGTVFLTDILKIASPIFTE